MLFRSEQLARSLGQLRGITADLQRTAMALRMVPIRGAFQKMSRLVRDLTVPLVRQLESRMKVYRQDRKRREIEQIERDRQQSIAESRRRQDQLEVQKQNQIKELSNRFNDLMEAGQYQEAIGVAYQICEIGRAHV